MRRSRLLAALEFADRTGRGQLVEVPMIETVLNVTAVQTMEFEVFGKIMERRGNRGHRCDAAGHLPVRRRRQLDRGERPHRRRAGRVGRAHRRSRVPTSSEWFATQDVDAVVEPLAAAGIPAAVVISPSLVTENPQLVHRGFFERLDASEHRSRPVPVSAVRPARRRRKLAASHAADVGSAQQRGADRAVWADRGRSRSAGRRGCHRHQAEGTVRGTAPCYCRDGSMVAL